MVVKLAVLVKPRYESETKDFFLAIILVYRIPITFILKHHFKDLNPANKINTGVLCFWFGRMTNNLQDN